MGRDQGCWKIKVCKALNAVIDNLDSIKKQNNENMLGNLCDGSFQGHTTGWPWSQDQEFRFPQRLDSKAGAVSSEMLQL